MLVLAAAFGMGGCGDTSYYGVDPHACDHFPTYSEWDVSLDYGAGSTSMQHWTITRDHCSLTIAAEPRDAFSPHGSYGDGFVQDPGFWGTWINTVETCDYYMDMKATMGSGSFTASIDWNRRANRSGACALAKGLILVTASLR